MSYVLHVLRFTWAGFHLIAPFIFLALIPSVLNALVPYLRAAGFMKVLNVALELVSVLARRDSPGTFKLPFTVSRPPLAMARRVGHGSRHPSWKKR